MSSKGFTTPASGVKGISGQPVHSTISKDNTNPSARNALLLRGFGLKNQQVLATTSKPETAKTLFVANLSFSVDDEWLKSEFEDAGRVSGARVVVDRLTGRSKGFGYVEFLNSASAATAIYMKRGVLVDGRPLRIDFAATDYS